MSNDIDDDLSYDQLKDALEDARIRMINSRGPAQFEKARLAYNEIMDQLMGRELPTHDQVVRDERVADTTVRDGVG